MKHALNRRIFRAADSAEGAADTAAAVVGTEGDAVAAAGEDDTDLFWNYLLILKSSPIAGGFLVLYRTRADGIQRK